MKMVPDVPSGPRVPLNLSGIVRSGPSFDARLRLAVLRLV